MHSKGFGPITWAFLSRVSCPGILPCKLCAILHHHTLSTRNPTALPIIMFRITHKQDNIRILEKFENHRQISTLNELFYQNSTGSVNNLKSSFTLISDCRISSHQIGQFLCSCNKIEVDGLRGRFVVKSLNILVY